MSSPVSALAKDDVIHSYSSYTFSDEEIEQAINEQINNQVSPMMDEYMYEYVNIGTKTTSKSPYYRAANQPIKRVVFETSAGSINWKDTSTVAATVSLSVSFPVGKGSISVGITPGQRVTSGTYSYSPQIKPSQVGKHVLLYVAKDFSVQHFAVYRYMKYSGSSTKQFYKYEDFKTLSSIYFDIRTVS
ncbi:hypothetical protein NMU03_01490 [Allocoprobacillus halotolerans]|uniref:Uncharacterized protein n=1 Tax=Allocoprobacillus halotolerans TaxID=2944914 RepID=A0ABY5I2E2_9FIRM|nr:hypothetical protein [Allocoprobacillus halotolerans]UTY39536.1 hypothetical protein NMU03_01490 [Allocoprobacillus halotolerans]